MSHAERPAPRFGFIPTHVRGMKGVAYLVLFIAAYVFTARLCQGQIFKKSEFGLLWPPSALFVAALILTPRQSWWAVLGAAGVAHVLAIGPVTPAWRMAWQIPLNSVFAIGTTEVLRRFVGLPLRFENRREVLVYLGLAIAMSTLFACLSPAFVMAAIGVERMFSPPIAFVRWVLADVTPLLLVTPAIVLAVPRDHASARGASRLQKVEAALIVAAVFIASLVIFNVRPEIARFPWFLLLTFPPLIWAAVRLGPAGVSAALLWIAAASIWGAMRHLGPFVKPVTGDVVLSLQIYWIVIWPPIMLLAAAVREREAAEAALHEQRSQLARATRIATVGELSGTLAHELRQPMQSILSSAEAGLLLLRKEHVDITQLREIFEDIVLQDKHASSVIIRLRELLKGGTLSFEPLALDSVVRDALALTESTVVRAGVDVKTEIPTALPPVHGDHVHLLQVLVNLVVNGCEAMSRVPVADRVLSLRVGRTGQDRLEVCVADSGTGLPALAEDRVFEPFYTTKDAGLGLGLSIGRSIASAHGGRLWAENNVGEGGGATFHLELPLVAF